MGRPGVTSTKSDGTGRESACESVCVYVRESVNECKECVNAYRCAFVLECG